MDQIDFTGPFEVFARVPDTTVRRRKGACVASRHAGLRLMPDVSVGQSEAYDFLVVPGGYGQQCGALILIS
jgi:cyclohexyl-isocyanide hydratase